MLSENDLMRVQSITQSMKRTVRLKVCLTVNDNIFEIHLANIARQLAGVSLNRISIEESCESPIPGAPCLSVSSERPSNIHYMMLPEGPQLSPFLEAISWLGEASQMPTFPGWENIQTLPLPLSILTFVATGCPHCPEAVNIV